MRTMRVLLVGLLLVLVTSGWAQTAKWTFMVYQAADNDLEQFGISDFNEMETVGSNDDVQIIVQFDRSPQYDISNGNWTDTRRFRVMQDLNTSTISSPAVQNLGEVNMGAPQSLVDFVRWAIQNYPAQRYCLVLWDHGGGWKGMKPGGRGLRTTPLPVPPNAVQLSDLVNTGGGNAGGPGIEFKNPFRSGWGPGKDVCVDETDNDRLMTDEIAGALQSVGTRIDVIGFDACLMGMIENAYEIRELVSYMVGSEETEPGDGWAYDQVLSAIRSNPDMTAAQLSTTLVQKYAQFYGSDSQTDQTFSAVDMSKIEAVVTALNGFAQALGTANSWTQVDQARGASDSYNKGQHIDLYDFADRVGGLVPVVASQTNGLKTALNAFVIENYAEPSHANSHGMAVYFPPSSAYDPRYANGILKIDFAADTQWDEMIQASYQGGGGGGGEQNVDLYEPNDTFAQAYGPVTSGFTYNGYITSRNDVDLYRIVAGSTFDVRVDLTVPADYDLYLLRKSGEEYLKVDSSLNMNLQAELIEGSGLAAGEYYVAVLYLWNNDNFSPNPYQLTVTQSGGSGMVNVLLQYDDDTPDYGVYSGRSDFNEGAACYFIPPVTPAQLLGFYYDIVSLDAFPGTGGSDGSFYAFGADYYGPLLPDTLRHTQPGGTGWHFLDLSADNIVLYGDFFAGLFWDLWNSPMVGWDTNSTNGLNLVYTEFEGIRDWYLWEGTFFIRAAVSYLNQVTGVTEQTLLAPTQFHLSQNYPNPFNPGTTIKYELPRSSVVKLSVFDMLGREVAVLVNERKNAGLHEVRFNASGLATGAYFYRLQADGFVQSKKLLVLK